jgi:circadian clock protein KaiB
MPTQFKFSLYIAGSSPHSKLAVANLTALCREHLEDCHQVEIVDVLREPKRALADGIIFTPVLVKQAPKPTTTIVGNLSNLEVVCATLGIAGFPDASHV